MGTSEFAVPALESVKDSVVLVVTQPDKPSGRGLEAKPSPVKSRAIEMGLLVESPIKSRTPEFVERVKSLDADVLLVAAYGQILSKAMLESTRFGGINLHGSILPKYRGAAPIQRCIENGDAETGVTLMQMDVGMDTGDIITVEKTPIGEDETAGELFERLAKTAAAMAQHWMPIIVSGSYPRQPQNDAESTHAPKVEKHEAELRVDRSARQEYNKFRAFTPSPGAFLRTTKGHVKLTQAALVENFEDSPGIVRSVKPELVLGFTVGSIALSEVQPEGKKRMTGAAWANGARIAVGERLTP